MGAIALAESLKYNHNLEIIKLKKNNIKFKGALAIADALKQHSLCTLKELDLTENNFENVGAEAFAEF